MITGLNTLRKIIDFKNAGGMGTQVPILAKKLQNKGINVVIDNINECDIIHIHNPMPNYLLLIKKARRKGKKIVIHARHLPELVKGGFKYGNLIYPFFHKYSQYFYNLADAVICATPYVREWMEKNKVSTQLYVIPNGVDLSFFKPSKEMREEFRERHNLIDEYVVFSVDYTFSNLYNIFQKKLAVTPFFAIV